MQQYLQHFRKVKLFLSFSLSLSIFLQLFAYSQLEQFRRKFALLGGVGNRVPFSLIINDATAKVIKII